MARKQLSYGSRGSEVTELQKLLNKNGYTLDEDGIFGNKTQDAVKDFQKKNGLTVDGIVGEQTWGLFDNGSTNEQTPSGYVSPYEDQIKDILDKILNREDFSYDLNGDALYQQYKDQHANMGNMAMMDTMGQAAAMTGGYGNSFAQTAGQQAYQGYLQQLNNRIPELYQLALDKYNADGRELQDLYSLYMGLDEQAYGRYRDEIEDKRWEEQFDYQKEQDKKARTYSGGGGFNYNLGGVIPQESKNTNLFKASVMTPSEFNRRGKVVVNGKTCTDYKSYIQACLEDWTNNGIPNSNGKLSDSDVAYLQDLYGL